MSQTDNIDKRSYKKAWISHREEQIFYQLSTTVPPENQRSKSSQHPDKQRLTLNNPAENNNLIAIKEKTKLTHTHKLTGQATIHKQGADPHS